jgi:hypothetical protein
MTRLGTVTPTIRSPRKSMKAVVDSANDFVAPFENFLDESVMEEDFLLHGNDEKEAFYHEEDYDSDDDNLELTRDFIDEGDGGSVCILILMFFHRY